jgi:hypothetical protein
VIAAYGNRLCAGGTNVLFAFRMSDRDDFAFHFKRRSKKVSTAKRAFCLVPSAMHQPTTRSRAEEEASVAATVYREIDEELFGAPETPPYDNRLGARLYMEEPHLAWFINHPDRFRLEVVSFGLNLVDGTFEFGVLLVVDDESYGQYWNKMKTNKEFFDDETPPIRTSNESRLAAIMTDPRSADTSLIALVEGIRRMNHLYPSSVHLPNIEVVR